MQSKYRERQFTPARNPLLRYSPPQAHSLGNLREFYLLQIDTKLGNILVRLWSQYFFWTLFVVSLRTREHAPGFILSSLCSSGWASIFVDCWSLYHVADWTQQQVSDRPPNPNSDTTTITICNSLHMLSGKVYLIYGLLHICIHNDKWESEVFTQTRLWTLYCNIMPRGWSTYVMSVISVSESISVRLWNRLIRSGSDT